MADAACCVLCAWPGRARAVVIDWPYLETDGNSKHISMLNEPAPSFFWNRKISSWMWLSKYKHQAGIGPRGRHWRADPSASRRKGALTKPSLILSYWANLWDIRGLLELSEVLNEVSKYAIFCCKFDVNICCFKRKLILDLRFFKSKNRCMMFFRKFIHASECNGVYVDDAFV